MCVQDYFDAWYSSALYQIACFYHALNIFYENLNEFLVLEGFNQNIIYAWDLEQLIRD